jgi:hypothetical protein
VPKSKKKTLCADHAATTIDLFEAATCVRADTITDRRLDLCNSVVCASQSQTWHTSSS